MSICLSELTLGELSHQFAEGPNTERNQVRIKDSQCCDDATMSNGRGCTKESATDPEITSWKSHWKTQKEGTKKQWFIVSQFDIHFYFWEKPYCCQWVITLTNYNQCYSYLAASKYNYPHVDLIRWVCASAGEFLGNDSMRQYAMLWILRFVSVESVKWQNSQAAIWV